MLTPKQIKEIQKIKNPLARQRHLKYSQLPADLQELIFAVKTSDKINLIAEKNKLTVNQTWQVSHITGMILLGETNIVDFVKSLKERCDLSVEQARQLARDINSAIFLPVKESLKEIHHVSEWPREEESNQGASQGNDQRIVSLKEKGQISPLVNANNIVNLKEKH